MELKNGARRPCRLKIQLAYPAGTKNDALLPSVQSQAGLLNSHCDISTIDTGQFKKIKGKWA